MALPDDARLEQMRTHNAERADAVVEALVRAGVTRVFICPGSRSTPLVLAVARRGLTTHVLHDERVAGFCALGASRAGELPAVLTTSGTAVANLLPACCEAERECLPMVCVTADRPRGDVERGASQTVAQPLLLVAAARGVLDLEEPGSEQGSANVCATELDRALRCCHGVGAGPLHVNVRFAKPLEPPAAFSASTTRAAAEPEPDRPAPAVRVGAPDLVVVGALPARARPAVRRLLERLGAAVVADIASGLPSSVQSRLPALALRGAGLRAALAPSRVVWIGGLLTDDAVATWLAERRQQGGVEITRIATIGTRRDPFGLFDAEHALTPEAFDAVVVDGPERRSRHDLVRMAARALAPIVARLDDGPLCEPATARAVVRSARPGEALFLGNSMPIRDADSFAFDVLADNVAVHANRGVAGIDGNLGTGLGVALAGARPTTMLLGDLAVLHDLSGLAAIGAQRAPVRVVVINNRGGGIFSLLPVSDALDAAAMRLFEASHDVALVPVAAALGLTAVAATDRADLARRLSSPVVGPELLEVSSDTHENARLHRELHAAAGAAVDRALAGMRGVA